MKTKHLSGFFCLLLLATWGTSLSAQTMPQDNWRYDQHQFSAPDPNQPLRSIAIGSGGVYVGQGNPATAILQFQENGVFIRQFGSFNTIVGIACDSVGNVYVLDATNATMTVNAFDQDGTFLRQWGSEGTNDAQFGQSVDATTMLAVGTNDEIFVCDPGNTRVQVFDTQGNFLRKWGVPGNLPGQFSANYPNAIAVRPNGWIYATSYMPGSYDVLAEFDATGNCTRWFMPQSDHWSSSILTLAVTADGILAVNAFSAYGHNNLGFYDANNTIISPVLRLSSRGVAFNRRGDVYGVDDTKVQIYEREYSSVQNPSTPPAIPQPIVLSSIQRTNTAWLDIDFQITDTDSATVAAGALAFLNGGNTISAAVPMSTFMEGTGSNLGTNVPSGTKLHLTWNMGADWSIDFGQIQVEVLAKDSRNLMGFHWITIPTDGTNATFQASSVSVSELELLSVWYWFIAMHQPGMSFSGGSVTGAGGDYDGQLLASDAGTTAAGRSFAYSQMDVRAITQAEIDRINAGSYGFIVDANSVVKLP